MTTDSIVVLRRDELDSLVLSWGEIISGLTVKLEPPLEADSAAGDAVFLPLDFDVAIAACVVNGATAYIVDDRDSATRFCTVPSRAYEIPTQNVVT